jgi:L,D-transpeptidase ErfK/SrfK
MRHVVRPLTMTLILATAGCSLLPLPQDTKPAAPAAELPPLPTTRFELGDPQSNIVGELQVMRARAKDTFIDIAQAYDLGYDELVEANPGVDPWLPGEGTLIVLPSRFVLPDAPREGIVLNVASKRLYWYPKTGKGALPVVHTFPISIGREGWATPLGRTRVTTKTKDPVWRVPASIRKEHAENGDPLPAVVPPGPDNPLGRHAMRLALPGDYLIHGTNKPAGVGMRVSHGCIRMNPEDIEWLFPQVAIGTPVHLVNQPVLVGHAQGQLYIEAHQNLEEDKTRRTAAVYKEVDRQLKRFAPPGSVVDFERVNLIGTERRGLPVAILAGSPDLAAAVAAARPVANVVTYDWFAGDEPVPTPESAGRAQ